MNAAILHAVNHSYDTFYMALHRSVIDWILADIVKTYSTKQRIPQS